MLLASLLRGLWESTGVSLWHLGRGNLGSSQEPRGSSWFWAEEGGMREPRHRASLPFSALQEGLARAPCPVPHWPGRQVVLVRRGRVGGHPGPLRQSFAPLHRLSHRGKGLSPAAGTVDRSAGEGRGLVAWMGKAAAPDPILGEMEGSSWVWPLPREVGEGPIQPGHVFPPKGLLPAQPNCPAHSHL